MLLVLLLPSLSRADNLADEAELQFDLGVEAFKRTNYRAALEHFLASNRLSPNQYVLFNIGRAYERLGGHEAEAYRYYYQAEKGEIDPSRRREAAAAIDAIKSQVAVLNLNTEPPGATVYIDRKDLGARGQTPVVLALKSGTHKIMFEKAGYESVERPLPPLNNGDDLQILEALEPSGKLEIKCPNSVNVEFDVVVLQKQVNRPLQPTKSCITPCTIRTPPGIRVVHLSHEDYDRRDFQIQVTEELQTICPPLDKRTGQVEIVTTGATATVRVDDDPKSRGVTPLVLTLPIGKHTIHLHAEGFHDKDLAAVVAADMSVVRAAFLPAQEVGAVSRSAEPVEQATASVTIIPREELVAFGYPTLAEALRGVRGLYVSDDRSYASLGVRGLGGLGNYTNRELVLVDGHPTNDNWTGSAYLGFDARSDLADIDRIEVVRGPGSVIYGTNAFSGVTNLVTRPVDSNTRGEAGISAAGPGIVRGRVRVQHPFARDSSMWLSVSGAKGSGNDFYFPELAGQGSQGHSVGADGFQTRTLQGRVTWKALTMQAFINSHDKRLSTGEYDSLLGDPRSRQGDTRGFVEFRADPVLSSGVQLLHRTYWNLYRFRGSYARDASRAGVEYDNFDGQWAGVEERLVLSRLKNWRVEVGFEYQLHYRINQRAWDDDGVFLGSSAGTPHRHVVGAVYGLASYKYSDSLSVLAATRNDHHSRFGWSTNPRVAVVLRPYSSGNTKVMWGAAFRAPSVYEMYYNDSGFTQTGSANLSPERLYSLELEHTHRFSSTVSAIGAVYGNYIKDPIVTRGAGDANDPLQYRNSSSPLLSFGTELLLRREWHGGFMAEASVGLQRTHYLASESISDLISNTRDESSRRVANSPAYLAALKTVIPLISKKLSAATRVTLEGPRADRYEFRGAQAQQVSDAVLLWDVVLSGSVDELPLKYSFGAYNLANYNYSLPVSAEFTQRMIRQNGRTFLASMDIAF